MNRIDRTAQERITRGIGSGPTTPKPDIPLPPEPDSPDPGEPSLPHPIDPDHPFPSYEDVPPVQPVD